MKTVSVKAKDIKRNWVLLDAGGCVLGRFATEVVRLLRGKHRVDFTPHMDVGDFVVIVNVEKLRVTGRKTEDKIYYRHTGYPGGIRSCTFSEKQAKDPVSVLQLAVKGMLPKGPLGYALLKKMKAYVGNAHPHTAQAPVRKALLAERSERKG